MSVERARAVSSSVEVPADPSTAFEIFTEEVGLWWVQGPINFYDSSRAFGKRIEPGVGGRIVEVYDEATGDGLELGRITVWEPGERLAWDSSRDDVHVEVRFVGSGGDATAVTAVTVEATIPEGGADRGGTSWVRMTPVWLPLWCDKRDRSPRAPERLSRLGVAVHYDKPAAAATWLRDVFAFEPAGAIPDEETDDTNTWIEFHVGGALMMVFKRDGGEVGSPTHTPWVFVDDLDGHFARAKAGGARIVNDIWQHGARAYDVEDLEGNRWTFAQAGPSMR